MFKKILIANRGEIALRVICACRELGIKTVAVYSEADENSLHVRFADEDVCIGPARSADSYLSVPAVMSAAEITGADAIHPGYGFLSESAYLAEVCEACHIKFIGPDAERHPAARRQGARAPRDEEGRRADPAGQRRPGRQRGQGAEGRHGPRLPGHHQGGRRRRRPRDARHPRPGRAVEGAQDRAARSRGRLRRRRRLHREVRRAPRVTSSSRCSAITTATSSTSASASARSSGAIRSCSRSRRRSALTDKMRRKLGSMVVDAARAVQYTNAGTFEFLMDDKGNFYFMEVNTRLQVEHPVTELVTGIDIVKEQIRIAAGERLSFKQGDVDVHRPLHRVPDQRRGSGDVRAVTGRDSRVQRAGRTRRARRHVRALRVHHPAVLRLDDRQDHRPRPRPPGSDRADAAHARDDGHRRHQDHRFRCI